MKSLKMGIVKMSDKKPPIGVEPEWYVKEKRRKELASAIRRYMKDTHTVPAEWITEFNELVKYENTRKKLL